MSSRGVRLPSPSDASSEIKPMSPIEFMVRSDLKRHIETAAHLRKVRETRSWLKEAPYKALSFEELLEERYDRAPAWFRRVSAILDEHPPSTLPRGVKILRLFRCGSGSDQ